MFFHFLGLEEQIDKYGKRKLEQSQKHYGYIDDSCSCPQPAKETLKPLPKGDVIDPAPKKR